MKITRNVAKSGVEVRFDSRPSDDKLATLNANGFQWSRAQRLWYARETPGLFDRITALLSGETHVAETLPDHPWQMTHAQYIASVQGQSLRALDGATINVSPKLKYEGQLRLRELHRQHVRQALSDGEPVTLEILKELFNPGGTFAGALQVIYAEAETMLQKLEKRVDNYDNRQLKIFYTGVLADRYNYMTRATARDAEIAAAEELRLAEAEAAAEAELTARLAKAQVVTPYAGGKIESFEHRTVGRTTYRGTNKLTCDPQGLTIHWYSPDPEDKSYHGHYTGPWGIQRIGRVFGHNNFDRLDVIDEDGVQHRVYLPDPNERYRSRGFGDNSGPPFDPHVSVIHPGAYKLRLPEACEPTTAKEVYTYAYSVALYKLLRKHTPNPGRPIEAGIRAALAFLGMDVTAWHHAHDPVKSMLRWDIPDDASWEHICGAARSSAFYPTVRYTVSLPEADYAHPMFRTVRGDASTEAACRRHLASITDHKLKMSQCEQIFTALELLSKQLGVETEGYRDAQKHRDVYAGMAEELRRAEELYKRRSEEKPVGVRFSAKDMALARSMQPLATLRGDASSVAALLLDWKGNCAPLQGKRFAISHAFMLSLDAATPEGRKVLEERFVEDVDASGYDVYLSDREAWSDATFVGWLPESVREEAGHGAYVIASNDVLNFNRDILAAVQWLYGEGLTFKCRAETLICLRGEEVVAVVARARSRYDVAMSLAEAIVSGGIAPDRPVNYIAFPPSYVAYRLRASQRRMRPRTVTATNHNAAVVQAGGTVSLYVVTPDGEWREEVSGDIAYNYLEAYGALEPRCAVPERPWVERLSRKLSIGVKLTPGDGIPGVAIDSKHRLVRRGETLLECKGKIDAKKICYIWSKCSVDFTKAGPLSEDESELLLSLVDAADWECGPDELDGQVREVIERILD